MLSEQQAIEVARAAFNEKLPHAVISEVTGFTVDDGSTWTVHFRRPPREEVDAVTGAVTTTIESNSSWILCVDGETGRVGWVETL